MVYIRNVFAGASPENYYFCRKVLSDNKCQRGTKFDFPTSTAKRTGMDREDSTTNLRMEQTLDFTRQLRGVATVATLWTPNRFRRLSILKMNLLHCAHPVRGHTFATHPRNRRSTNHHSKNVAREFLKKRKRKPLCGSIGERNAPLHRNALPAARVTSSFQMMMMAASQSQDVGQRP